MLSERKFPLSFIFLSSTFWLLIFESSGCGGKHGTHSWKRVQSMESERNWILQPISSRVHIQKKWISNPAGEVTSNSYSLCPCFGNKGLSSYHPANLPGHAYSVLSKAPLSVASFRSLPILIPWPLLSLPPRWFSHLPTPHDRQRGELCIFSLPLPMIEIWWQIQQILDPSSLEDLGRVSDVACCWIFSNSMETRSTCPVLSEGEAVQWAGFRTSGQFTGSLQSCPYLFETSVQSCPVCMLLGVTRWASC